MEGKIVKGQMQFGGIEDFSVLPHTSGSQRWLSHVRKVKSVR